MSHETGLADRVINRMAELGLTQADVARRARFNPGFISDLVRGKKRSLHPANYARLARALLTTPVYLQRGWLPTQEQIAAIAEEAGVQSSSSNGAAEARRAIPKDDDRALAEVGDELVGATRPSIGLERRRPSDLLQIRVFRSGSRFDGAAVLENPPLYQLRLTVPGQLNRLYAIAVSDSAMAPRYDPGDFVYAAEGVECRPRDYVAIRVRGRSGKRAVELAYVRQLLRIEDDEYVVRQISPSIETRYSRSSVVGMDRIVLAGDALDDMQR